MNLDNDEVQALIQLFEKALSKFTGIKPDPILIKMTMRQTLLEEFDDE